MAQQPIELQATARPRAGKGAARQARRDGNIPAVIYGDNQPPETINLNHNDLWKQYLKGHFTSTVIDLKIGKETRRVIPRDVQVDPVKDHPIHVDFLRIGKDGLIRAFVPVRFVNEALSPGLKRGGVLNVVRHEVEVISPYDRIPSFFEINLEGMQIGRSIHFSAITKPEGIEPVIKNRDFTIATIAGAIVKEDPAATADAAAPAADAKAAAAAKPAAGAKAAAPAAGGKAAPAAGKAAAPAAPAKKK